MHNSHLGSQVQAQISLSTIPPDYNLEEDLPDTFYPHIPPPCSAEVA